MEIQSITKLPLSISGNAAGSTTEKIGKTFQEIFNSLNETTNASSLLTNKLAAGEDVDIHQVLIAAEKADVSMRVALAVRDRLVESYREIIRMSV